MEKEEQSLAARYRALLRDYLQREDDRAVAALQALSGEFMRCQIGPGDVVAMHERALGEHLPGLPSVQASDACLRSMTFLRLAMQGFGVDPLRPYLEASVTNRFVGQILRELETEFRMPDVARVAIGRKYADNFEGDLQNYLDMFRLQGLGNLSLDSVDDEQGEIVFTGHDIFESYEASDYPQDHFTRGFLARAVSLLTHRPMNCEEVDCQAQGASACRFVVTPVTPAPLPHLRRLLQG